MIVFFGCKRAVCTRERSCRWAIPFILSMAVACLFSAGCKKCVKPPEKAPVVLENVLTNRMNNVAYVESLKQLHRKQVLKGAAFRSAAAATNAYSNRVMAALPAGADGAVLEAALAKDETWQKLKAQSDAAQKEDRQAVEEAREKVRQALMEEARAQQAVADGKAKAVDQVKTK